ncbi:B2 bradykinin receptor-like [Pholidichthys leucotaenia]
MSVCFSSAEMDLSPARNSSNTSLEEPCLINKNNSVFTAMPVYIVVITVLGIVLNVFVLAVFCFHKKSCTVAEIYLSNLALADLVLLCFLPFWAKNIANRYIWTFSKGLCKLVNSQIAMNAYCSIYFLVLVSIDRYMALVHPLSSERIRRPFYAKLGCLMVWIFGFLLTLPILIFRNVKVHPELNTTQCLLDYGEENKYLHLRFELMTIILGFIIPICIIFVSTLKIIAALKGRLLEALNDQKKEHKATALILTVLLAFLICWVPFHLGKILGVLFFHGYLRCSVTLYIYQQISIYLAFFNSVLNPLLYVIVGKNFQKKAKELFSRQSSNRTLTFSLVSARTNV